MNVGAPGLGAALPGAGSGVTVKSRFASYSGSRRARAEVDAAALRRGTAGFRAFSARRAGALLAALFLDALPRALLRAAMEPKLPRAHAPLQTKRAQRRQWLRSAL